MIWKKKKTENVSEQEQEPAEKPKKFTLKRPVIHGRRVIVICVLAVILALAVVVVRTSQSLRGAVESGLLDLRAAFVAMAALGVLSALAFLCLAPGTGREVSGHGG